jgi:hypothetical protein
MPFRTASSPYADPRDHDSCADRVGGTLLAAWSLGIATLPTVEPQFHPRTKLLPVAVVPGCEWMHQLRPPLAYGACSGLHAHQDSHNEVI